ncbi:MAG: hypothetical protein AAB674_01645 [Patescibacteria group bacterium]
MIKYTVPILLKDKYIFWTFIASLVIFISAFFIAYVNLWGAGNLLIIHSDIFKGADFFGNFKDVFGIIAVAGFVWFLNLGLAQIFYFRERFLSYSLAFSTFIFMVLILISVNVIININ